MGVGVRVEAALALKLPDPSAGNVDGAASEARRPPVDVLKHGMERPVVESDAVVTIHRPRISEGNAGIV